MIISSKNIFRTADSIQYHRYTTKRCGIIVARSKKGTGLCTPRLIECDEIVTIYVLSYSRFLRDSGQKIAISGGMHPVHLLKDIGLYRQNVLFVVGILWGAFKMIRSRNFLLCSYCAENLPPIYRYFMLLDLWTGIKKAKILINLGPGFGEQSTSPQ